jgi:hypothetical protein
MHKNFKAVAPDSANIYNRSIFDRIYGFNSWRIDYSKYDALIPIPMTLKYFLPFEKAGSDMCQQIVMATSYHTALPIAGMNLSRPSVTHAKKIRTLIEQDSLPYIASEYRNKRFLVIYVPDTTVTNGEKYLIKKCDSTLYVGKNFSVLSLKTQ